jgi:hypothetical protein
MTASAVPSLAPLTINPPAFEHRRLARSAFGASMGGVRTEELRGTGAFGSWGSEGISGQLDGWRTLAGVEGLEDVEAWL